jgi:hypothetical protein
MLLMGFEPANLANERSLILALDRTATYVAEIRPR